MNNFKWVDVLAELKEWEMQSVVFNQNTARGSQSQLSISKTSTTQEDISFPCVECCDPAKLQPLIDKMIQEDNIVPVLCLDSSFGSGESFRSF